MQEVSGIYPSACDRESTHRPGGAGDDKALPTCVLRSKARRAGVERATFPQPPICVLAQRHRSNVETNISSDLLCNSRETNSIENVFLMKIKDLFIKVVLVIQAVSCARLRVRAIVSFQIGRS